MKIERYLAESPVFHCWSTFHILKRHLDGDAFLKSLGFLPSLALSALFLEYPQPLTPSELASRFDTSRTSMSHLISSLEKKKLIRRTLHMRDARSYQIVLSAEGVKKARRLIKTFDQIQRKIEKKMGERSSLQLVNLLKDLREIG